MDAYREHGSYRYALWTGMVSLLGSFYSREVASYRLGGSNSRFENGGEQKYTSAVNQTPVRLPAASHFTKSSQIL